MRMSPKERGWFVDRLLRQKKKEEEELNRK